MGKSFLEILFSIKNFPKGNNTPKPNGKLNLQNKISKKGKIIIKRKITHKPGDTDPKTKPIDN